MLRINLLPPYIYDKQKKIKWIVGSFALIAITAVALVWAAGVAESARQKALADKSEADSQKAAYDKVVQDINNENAKIAATKAKQEFVANAIKYNEAWPQIYTEMRDLTSPRVLLKSMYVGDDRKTINFTGFCQYEEDLVRWWMFLRSQPMFTNVHFQLPPHPFQPGGENTAGGGAGMMGAGIGRPRMGGISGAGGPMSSGMGGPGMGGGGSFGGGMGTPRASGMSGAGGPMSGGMGGPGMSGGGSFGGGGGNSGSVGPEEIEGRRGIAFTAFAQLKQALAGGIPTPSWGTAPAAGAGGPGFGGPPAGGSGMMGSMGGSMGGGMGAPGRGKGAAD